MKKFVNRLMATGICGLGLGAVGLVGCMLAASATPLLPSIAIPAALISIAALCVIGGILLDMVPVLWSYNGIYSLRPVVYRPTET